MLCCVVGCCSCSCSCFVLSLLRAANIYLDDKCCCCWPPALKSAEEQSGLVCLLDINAAYTSMGCHAFVSKIGGRFRFRRRIIFFVNNNNNNKQAKKEKQLG